MHFGNTKAKGIQEADFSDEDLLEDEFEKESILDQLAY